MGIALGQTDAGRYLRVVYVTDAEFDLRDWNRTGRFFRECSMGADPSGGLPLARRSVDACIETQIGCHSFRATGITEYLHNGGKLEVTQ